MRGSERAVLCQLLRQRAQAPWLVTWQSTPRQQAALLVIAPSAVDVGALPDGQAAVRLAAACRRRWARIRVHLRLVRKRQVPVGAQGAVSGAVRRQQPTCLQAPAPLRGRSVSAATRRLPDLQHLQAFRRKTFHERAWMPHPSLIDCQGILVGDRRPHAVQRCLVAHVETKDQRRRHHAPQAEVRPLFVRPPGLRAAEVADLEHVGVGPAAGPGLRVRAVAVGQRGVGLPEDAVEGGADVAAGAEEVHGAGAGGGVRHPVVAVLDAHPPARGVEKRGEARDVSRGAAGVDLDAVEGHGGEPGHVLLVVSWRSTALHADAVVEVRPHLQAQRVAVVDQTSHVGKPLGVDDGPTRRPVVPRALAAHALVDGARGQRGVLVLARGAVALLPAVVHAHPAEAQVAQCRRFATHGPRPIQHRAHRDPHPRVRDGAVRRHAVVDVPRPPPPRRRCCQPVVETPH
mmetsp:Transcript_30145/g.76191  ORF Transcript_30145/g.76191 Transcript_30145/m.76191 type:complete len:458 (-) Transcript_30145:31-1404(-)